MATYEYEKPLYRASNPKIDLYGKDGEYICSTNWHRSCRNALAYYKDTKPEWHVRTAELSSKCRQFF
jgi:hypothetical protein